MAKGRRHKEKDDATGVAEAAGTPLRGELLHKALGDVSRTADGTGYAFTRLTCCGKGVTTLPDELHLFVHLRYIDISGNNIKELSPFSNLPYLLTLNASGNQIEDVSCLASPEAAPYLSLLNLSNNKIFKAPQLSLQRLTRLALDGNPITTLEGFVIPPCLTHLSLRGTPLESLESLPPSSTITSLYLSHTPISQLKELTNLPQIRTLDLEGVFLPTEQLNCLILLPKLREISISPSNSELGEEQFRGEILGILPRLRWINGNTVTTDDLRIAAAMREAKIKQQNTGEQQQLRQTEGRLEDPDEQYDKKDGQFQRQEDQAH